MSSGIATAEIDEARAPQVEPRPAAILKGGPRGLEILVDREATVEAIGAALTRRLEEAPGFFRGNDVRVRTEGALPAGCLGRLEEIAARFELAIVEVGPRKPRLVEASAPVLEPAFAAGSAPTPALPALDDFDFAAAAELDLELPEISIVEASDPRSDLSIATAVPAPSPARPASPDPAAEAFAFAAAHVSTMLAEAADVAAAALKAAALPPPPPPERTRMVVGPVRSGVILDHPGNLVVIGDVNPGAEVRAQGNIVILGRLRGIAHAGIGREHGFILALRLEPQQLRIGRLAARAPDARGSGTEIAYVTDRTIVVERYAGKLPFGLAAGI